MVGVVDVGCCEGSIIDYVALRRLLAYAYSSGQQQVLCGKTLSSSFTISKRTERSINHNHCCGMSLLTSFL